MFHRILLIEWLVEVALCKGQHLGSSTDHNTPWFTLIPDYDQKDEDDVDDNEKDNEKDNENDNEDDDDIDDVDDN